MTDMAMTMIKTLAAIDDALGLPQDGCNEPEQTLYAIAELKAGFFKQLREINVDRCVNGFKHQLSDWSVMEWGCAIGGEAGELLNILKKIRRAEQNIGGSRVDGDSKQAVADEIADIIIYCDLLAAKMGIDLQTAITRKFNETSKKIGYVEVLE